MIARRTPVLNVFFIYFLLSFHLLAGEVKPIQPIQIKDITELIRNLLSASPKAQEEALSELDIDKGAYLLRVRIISPYCMGINGENPIVLGLSWKAPYDGFIVFINEDGIVTNKIKVGYIKSIQLQDITGDWNDEIILDVIKGSGTGTRLDEFVIFQVTPKGLHKLWEEVSYVFSFPGVFDPEMNYELNAWILFKDFNDDRVMEIVYKVEKKEYKYSSETKELILAGVKRDEKVFKLSKDRYIVSERHKK